MYYSLIPGQLESSAWRIESVIHRHSSEIHRLKERKSSVLPRIYVQCFSKAPMAVIC